MAATKQRAREKQDLRQTILAAARELFATQSYKDVSIRRIAEKIDYSPGALYLHFRDKDEILASLAEEGFQLLAQSLAKADAGDALERLREVAHSYLDFAATQPHAYRLMFELGDGVKIPANDPKKPPMGREAFQVILAAVRQGVAAGYLSAQIDETIAGHIFWAELHGIASLQLAGRLGLLPKEDRKTFFEAAIDTVLCGLSPSCDP